VDPISPVPGRSLEGYLQEVSMVAGESISVMLSGGPDPWEIEVARLIHGDPNPIGPGVREQVMDWGRVTGSRLSRQPLDLGSFLEVPADNIPIPPGDLSISIWVYPTLLNRLWQSLAARWAPGELSFGLFLGGHHTLAAAFSHDGVSAEWATGRNYLWPGTWQLIVVSYSSETGEVRVHVYVRDEADPATSRKFIRPGPLHQSRAPLLFGALPGDEPGRHWAHLNGKIASPAIFGVVLGQEAISALARGADASDVGPVVAAWDLSQDVSSARVVDTGPARAHALAVNAPGRAVTGPQWRGQGGSLYTDTPRAYDAVYLHDDDLADARWTQTALIRVPATARSGIYAVRCRTGSDAVTMPVVIRPTEPASRICFLVPTYTWQAYASNRARHSFTEDGVLDRALCLYDVHTDGSIVNYCTRRKPTRSGDPSAGLQWGAHCLAANLYLIDWLEQKGFAYEVTTDENLHAQGQAALDKYSCVILGSHPEYWTLPMLEAFRSYITGGGRALYLGGNGLYWVTSVDTGHPFIIEVRKSGDGDYEDNWSRPAPGELQHSTTLETGGLWSRRAWPPRGLVGVEMAATVVRDAAGQWGYLRTPQSRTPPYDFIFEGVADEVIGDFGLNLGTAAGYEMDAVQDWPWGQAHTVLLARATSEHFIPHRRLPAAAAADLALTTWPGGGAVFAAGAVTWTGSLSHAGYANNVSKITENVIKRFLSTPGGQSVLDTENPGQGG
jgi:N,N-dimethylformamidase